MEHVSFVVLHYCSIEITEQCIKSIQNNIEYDNYSIVIIDNASPDNSGLLLKEKYEKISNIKVLLMDTNLGFAKGNNVGYLYAKNVFNADFIVVTNSDTVFTQKDFIDKIRKIFYKEKFYLLGPDLITPSGIHQNPHRNYPLTKNQLKKMLFIKQIFLWYFYIKKFFHIDNKINILENMFEKKDKITQNNIPYRKKRENVVLQGACIIYSPLYISKENEAFSPKTFMYGEEDILTYLCCKKNYKILYSPNIRVKHLNGEITRNKYGNSIDKNIFTYKYIVEGCKILLSMMNEKEK